MASAPAAWITLRWKLTGPSFVVSTACSSGAYAIHAAHMLIASGQCDAVVTGSISSTINFLDVEGFGSLMALAVDPDSPLTSSRPFDKNRKGFVMGEGGGILVLESLESAEKRGAEVLAISSLPGLNSEAYNILSPRHDGEGMAGSMALALKNAGLKPQDIDYINAHGTSTVVNDLYETLAIKKTFGDHAFSVPVSSTKSMTGHCLAGAAGVEAAICVQALRRGVIPPTINLHHPDPELGLDFVPLTPRPANLRHVMSNSFAFGGHNGTNIFSKP
jgi:3-oxoacyl-[acyl-carrier-protein] synthase II